MSQIFSETHVQNLHNTYGLNNEVVSEISEPLLVKQNLPIVRVIEKTTVRNLQKFAIANLGEEDSDEDVLAGAYQIMVEGAAEEYLAKQIEELNATNISDVDHPNSDPEVENLLEAIIDDEGEYVREPGEITFEEDLFTAPEEVKPEEETMKDTKAKQEESEQIKPNKRLTSASADATKRMAQKSSGGPMTCFIPETDSLQFLKSVEGRVLTIMEAAIPDKEQRNAIKTLIKKEFRREMSKAGRFEEPDED